MSEKASYRDLRDLAVKNETEPPAFAISIASRKFAA
jgi:hypothetical protein